MFLLYKCYGAYEASGGEKAEQIRLLMTATPVVRPLQHVLNLASAVCDSTDG